MNVRIHYNALLRISGYESGTRIELPEGSSVKDLFDLLGIGRKRHGRIVMSVNGEAVWNSTKLKDNDAVVLHVTLGGG
jgi:sulfur carrier protein ThiS